MQPLPRHHYRDWDHYSYGHTARLTTSYCAPSLQSELITNMQNHLEHHLVSTKLCCALPKCTSYRTTVHCEPWFACSLSTTKILYSILCVHAFVHKMCPICACSVWTTKKWKFWGRPLLLTSMGPPFASWCKTFVPSLQPLVSIVKEDEFYWFYWLYYIAEVYLWFDSGHEHWLSPINYYPPS